VVEEAGERVHELSSSRFEGIGLEQFTRKKGLRD
jgi:hypothetical protein